jgi:peptide deformylase
LKVASAADSILRYGDSRLRRRCRAVDPCSREAHDVADRLWSVFRSAAGIGLAAPQIGAELRICLARLPRSNRGPRRVELFNPEIVETFGPTESFEEGCLSFPGLYVHVDRPRGVAVRYTDRSGGTRTIRDDRLLARVLLHEIDHLDGVLFVDRLPRLRRLTLAGRLFWIYLRGRGSRS